MPLDAPRGVPSLRIAAGIALLFTLIAWKRGISVAAIVIACFAAGYATEFYLFRCVLAVLRRKAMPIGTIDIALSTIVVDAMLAYFGFGILLAMAVGMFLLMDGLVLRFK